MKKNALQTIIFQSLEDMKAKDIVAFNTEKLSGEFSQIVIATGTSNRHVCAIAVHVYAMIKEAGIPCSGNEGEDSGNWVVVDAGDWVVHVMQDSARQYYRLEELWGQHPLKLTRKRATATKATVKTTTQSTVHQRASSQRTRASAKQASTKPSPPPRKARSSTLSTSGKTATPQTATRKTKRTTPPSDQTSRKRGSKGAA